MSFGNIGLGSSEVRLQIQVLVLLLNQDYQPLNVCTDRRAVVLVTKDKADILQSYDKSFMTPDSSMVRPSVIRMRYYVKRARPNIRLTRAEVFTRDDHSCQYCGDKGPEFTIDHVIPKRLGGRQTWGNLVTSCRACNHRKGGRALRDAGMRLVKRPVKPTDSISNWILRSFRDPVCESWLEFFPRSVNHTKKT